MDRKMCGQCLSWEMGNFWGSGSGNHGVLIESKGWCTFKKNKRKRWNYCPSCENFNKRKMCGFIYQGGGGNTIEEDIKNITGLMKELAEGNK